MLSNDIYSLFKAHNHASQASGCGKVKVGALIVDQHGMHHYGANRVVNGASGCSWPNNPICNKILPHDGKLHCVSTIHAEIDAIVTAKRNLYRSTIWVTRYPCEACARTIVVAGIKTVVYGRATEISQKTREIFSEASVVCRHVPEFDEEE
jgi:dCMP deaminase